MQHGCNTAPQGCNLVMPMLHRTREWVLLCCVILMPQANNRDLRDTSPCHCPRLLSFLPMQVHHPCALGDRLPTWVCVVLCCVVLFCFVLCCFVLVWFGVVAPSWHWDPLQDLLLGQGCEVDLVPDLTIQQVCNRPSCPIASDSRDDS